jgi:hypothetical protein
MSGHPPSRIPGRGALLRTLRALLARVERYAEHRASTPALQRWSARLADDLDCAFAAAVSASGARAELEAYDRRRHLAQKVPIRGVTDRKTVGY